MILGSDQSVGGRALSGDVKVNKFSLDGAEQRPIKKNGGILKSQSKVSLVDRGLIICGSESKDKTLREMNIQEPEGTQTPSNQRSRAHPTSDIRFLDHLFPTVSTW